MKKSKGFTLIELLAVIVIIGILVTLVTVSVGKYIKNSKEKVKVQAAEEIIKIAKAYMIANNKNFVKVEELVNDGYLESNFTSPKTGEEYNSSSDNFMILLCTNSCNDSDSVNDSGFISSDIYLSFDNTLNENLAGADSDDSSYEFDYNEKKVIINNQVYTNKTIEEQIKIYNENNEKRGVLAMYLSEQEKIKLYNKLSLESGIDDLYLYYDSDELKYKNINAVDLKTLKYLGAKYILDVIKNNNKNYEIINPSKYNCSEKAFSSLYNYSGLKNLITLNKIINPNTGKLFEENDDLENMKIKFCKNTGKYQIYPYGTSNFTTVELE